MALQPSNVLPSPPEYGASVLRPASASRSFMVSFAERPDRKALKAAGLTFGERRHVDISNNMHVKTMPSRLEPITTLYTVSCNSLGLYSGKPNMTFYRGNVNLYTPQKNVAAITHPPRPPPIASVICPKFRALMYFDLNGSKTRMKNTRWFHVAWVFDSPIGTLTWKPDSGKSYLWQHILSLNDAQGVEIAKLWPENHERYGSDFAAAGQKRDQELQIYFDRAYALPEKVKEEVMDLIIVSACAVRMKALVVET